jgi:hypothetical protein
MLLSTNGDHDKARLTFPLQVMPRLQFLHTHPVLGYIHGGTEVVITFGNANFFSNLIRQFEAEANIGVFHSTDSFVCKSPAYRPGRLTLKLSSGETVLASGCFEYILPPIASTPYPNSGAPDGGTRMKMTGMGFLGLTHCRFRFEDDIKIVRATTESDSRFACFRQRKRRSCRNITQWTGLYQDWSSIQVSSATSLACSYAIVWIRLGGGESIHVLGGNFVDVPQSVVLGHLSWMLFTNLQYFSSVLHPH